MSPNTERKMTGWNGAYRSGGLALPRRCQGVAKALPRRFPGVGWRYFARVRSTVDTYTHVTENIQHTSEAEICFHYLFFSPVGLAPTILRMALSH